MRRSTCGSAPASTAPQRASKQLQSRPTGCAGRALCLWFIFLMIDRAVSQHLADIRDGPAPLQASRATGFSDAPPSGAYQLFGQAAQQAAAEPQAAPAPAMQASQAGFTDVVDIPTGMVGKLIGKGGETIKQLQYSTQTKIQIDHMTSGDVKKVSITGTTTELVEAAKAQVLAVVAGDERGGGGGGDAQNTVECPQGIVGRIIGRGGETIRALQQASQAHIVVDQNYPEGQPRRVNISGRPDAVDRATKMVTELIAGEPGSAQAIIQKVPLAAFFYCKQSCVRCLAGGAQSFPWLLFCFAVTRRCLSLAFFLPSRAACAAVQAAHSAFRGCFAALL